MITFQEEHKVFLDRKHVGTIKKVIDGYQYYPKGCKTGGEIFNSLQKCMNSLINQA